MKTINITVFAITLLLSQAVRAEDLVYSFEAFTEAFKDLTGEPFQAMTMKGIKSHTYLYNGAFDPIAEKAEVLIKEMGLQGVEAEEKALFDSAFDSVDKETMNVKGNLMYNVTPGAILSIMLMETSGMNMLIIQEVNTPDLSGCKEHSDGAGLSDVSAEEQGRGMKIAQGDLSAATNEVERFFALNHAAKNALDDGEIEKAEALARELEGFAPKYKGNWNYGNAIQDSNQVLGRIALSKGDIEEAKKRLLASADSKGSPQMNSFGPNMQLARALLEKGEKDVVLEYFECCGEFWEMGADRLEAWTEQVKNGEIPHFGGNLKY